ncbi:zinc finger protein 723-like [Belonocnema kinseyi]|uniref:zinc finger protein 723-like n=1 Tax=Belonocnema kinseyi TaxID=2817044 RepID=UPI00143DBA64|nr:zinc finger protein 723-like [Belonocnema kinseyi]
MNCDNYETLEIKEEIIEDQETTKEKRNNNYESKLCAVDIKEGNISSTKNKLRSQNKQKIQESRHKSGRKYKCEKCARTYKLKHTLKSHQKYDCNVVPQYSCKFCGKKFKRIYSMSRHIGRLHLKTDLQTSPARHNCDKCFRSYNWPYDLNRHKRLEHAADMPQFTCDYCGHRANQKSNLGTHIILKHLIKE